MSGGSQTSSTTSGPPPQVMQNYGQLVSGAESLVGQPLQQYTSPIVAGFNPTQQAAFSEVANAQGAQVPYLNAAAQEFGKATTPLWPTLPQFSASTVNQYMSPYTSDVTNSLQNLYDQQNAQQLEQIKGSSVGAGAYGGDREAVAEALAAQQQQLAEAPTLAQVKQQGYQAGIGEFNTQQQQQLAAEEANSWLGSQAGFGLASLGNQAQTGALTGASALLQSGGLQQQLAQEQMNVPYQEFTAAQAYPYQQLGFLAPIIEGTGSLSGGTGTTTYPGQSPLSQVAGLGLTGLGVYGLGQQAGWWGGAATPAFDAATMAAADGTTALTSGLPVNRGGRIHKMIGGPVMPGIGAGVPNIDLSYIPHQAPFAKPSSLGLSAAQPQVSQTVNSDPGIMGTIGPLLTIAKLASMAFQAGGHVHRDDGGAAPVPGQVDVLPQQQKGIGLPSVPQISVDHIIHPGPEIKGSGPPRAPNAPAGANNQFGIGQATQLLGEAKSLKGIGLSDSSDNAAGGGRIGLADGGVPIAVASQFGGAPPTYTSQLQQLLQLPLNRLQEMAIQYPPTSYQGQMVQSAIRQKQATPGTGTVTPPPSQPSQPQPGLGAPTSQPPATGGTSSIGTAQTGGTATSYAEGGATTGGYVTPDELDPLPVVDHSGDTVKVRYPSENKVLDLGLPSIRERRSLAAGGSAGTFTAPNGVAIPQLDPQAFSFSGLQTDPLTGGGYQPGGGSGNWMQPLAQYHPPGTQFGTGPGGSTVFPSTQLYSPGIGGIAGAFGISNIPGSLGVSTAPPSSAASGPPPLTIAQQEAIDSQAAASQSGGSKKGGRIGHFDDGGDVGDDSQMVSALPTPDSAVDLDTPKGIGVPHGTDSGEPTADSGAMVAPATAPTLQGLEPSLGPIVRRESHGQPYVGYTSPETLRRTGHVTDLRDAPIDKNGAPIWEGDMGPAGISHAFGPAQIQPGTWAPAAHALGITDWRKPGAYAAVANYIHDTQGDKPWAASAPVHGGIGGDRAPDEIVGTPAGIGSKPQAPVAATTTDQEPPERHHGFNLADYSMPLLIAGLSTLGSRSPNALAEGFRAAAPYLASQQRAISAENEAGYRNALLGLETQKAAPQIALGNLKANLFSGAVTPAGSSGVTGTGREGTASAQTAPTAPLALAAAPLTSTASTSPASNETTKGAPASAPSGQNPALTDPKLLEMHQEYQAQVAQIDQQISTVQRQLTPYDTPQMQRLALLDSTVASSRNALLSQLSGLQERRLGYVTGDPYNSAVAAGAKSAEEAYASLGPRALISLLERAGQVQSIAPGHIAVTGLTTFPPQIQSAITGALKSAGIDVTNIPQSGNNAANAPTPTARGTVQPAPAIPAEAPFVTPPDMASDRTLTQPSVQLVPAPGGGMTAAPTLPGLPELQKQTGERAAQAQKDIPELAKAEAALDTQHQEITAAAAQPNFYTGGAYADARKRIGTLINTVADMTGSPEWQIDQQHLADATAIDKAAYGLATQAVHGISARPSQLEFSQARNAVPSNELPAFSAILLSNTLRFQNQYQKGQAEYELQQYKNGADPSTAAAAWQAQNGNRVAGAALAQTYLDLAKARPNDPASQWVKRLLSVPANQKDEAIKQFDERFTPLSRIDARAFDVPSWGSLIIQLGAPGG